MSELKTDVSAEILEVLGLNLEDITQGQKKKRNEKKPAAHLQTSELTKEMVNRIIERVQRI